MVSGARFEGESQKSMKYGISFDREFFVDFYSTFICQGINCELQGQREQNRHVLFESKCRDVYDSNI